MTVSTDSDTAYNRFVMALAEMPGTIERLLLEHVPDSTGHCRTCRRPGTGTAVVKSPCPLARLALRARRAASL